MTQRRRLPKGVSIVEGKTESDTHRDAWGW